MQAFMYTISADKETKTATLNRRNLSTLKAKEGFQSTKELRKCFLAETI